MVKFRNIINMKFFSSFFLIFIFFANFTCAKANPNFTQEINKSVAIYEPKKHKRYIVKKTLDLSKNAIPEINPEINTNTNNNVQIAIIIPIYNVEPWLQQCLESIKNQTFENLKVICVNDGSTDNSREILQNIAKTDPRFEVINQENQGVSVARNVGLAFAKTLNPEFTMFVDSDDWLELNTCEKCVQVAQKHNADVISFCRNSATNNTKESIYDSAITAMKKEHILRIYCHHKIYRTKIIGDTRFPEDQTYAEDTAWNQVVCMNAKILVSLPDKLYNRRIRPGSLCSQASDIKIANQIKEYEFVAVNWHKNGFLGYDSVLFEWFMRANFHRVLGFPDAIKIKFAKHMLHVLDLLSCCKYVTKNDDRVLKLIELSNQKI
ncbi:MAG: glycosyltransferase [Candidatus Improbicoccus devescovinae]|nr:MAG: glycosyltransferase [Candidatus Improbicoccus devescovinae]